MFKRLTPASDTFKFMKYLLLLSALCFLCFCGYTPSIASKLIWMSAVAYEPVQDINAWNCSECKKFSVTEVKAFINTTLDMQGFVAYEAQSNAVIVAFRGSVDIKSWIADLDAPQMAYPKCSGCLVHVGFYKAYGEVSAEVKAQVQKIISKYRTAGIYVTGHSLGGAMAVIASLDLKATFGKLDQFYTYGQPRVGNQAFATYFESQITNLFRVVHYADIVPHVPPLTMLGYIHGGAQAWYDEAMAKYQICSAEDPACMDSIPSSKWSTGDHSHTQYEKLPVSLVQLLNLIRDS